MKKILFCGACCVLIVLSTACGVKKNPGLIEGYDNLQAQGLDQQGDAFFLSANYDAAFDLYQQALSIREASFGKDDPAVIHSLYNLATVFEVKKEYVQAIKHYRRAQTIAAKHGRTSDVQAIQGYIAVLFEARGMIGQSKAGAHHYASMYQKFAQGKHPFLGVVLYKLALFYWQENKADRAAEYFQEAIAFIEQNIGQDHPYLAVVLHDYATFLRETKPDNDVADIDQRAAKIRQHYPKKQHSALYNKGIILSRGDQE
jgi:tetratricopeptide (TPR) repeat protein